MSSANKAKTTSSDRNISEDEINNDINDAHVRQHVFAGFRQAFHPDFQTRSDFLLFYRAWNRQILPR